MSEVFHGEPVEVNDWHGEDKVARPHATVVIVVFNPVKQLVTCVGHKQLGNEDGVPSVHKSRKA